MKKILIIPFAAIVAMGCNSQPAPKEASAATPADSVKIDYAYLPEDHPADYWDRGKQENVAMVLKGLKALERGNVNEALSNFSDSIVFRADEFDAKISKDSLKSMLTYVWSNLKSMKIVMDDYESVSSKDKKKEYVTLWYKQLFTNKKGVTDSLALVNDFRIEDGKIISLDEATRKFPAKK